MEHTTNKVVVGPVGEPTTTYIEQILALPQSERLVVLEVTPALPVPAMQNK